MSYKAISLLLLIVQLLGFVGGSVVLCQHQDGTSALEFVGSRCCDDQPEQDNSPVQSIQATHCLDGCTDTPVKHDSTVRVKDGHARFNLQLTLTWLPLVTPSLQPLSIVTGNPIPPDSPLPKSSDFISDSIVLLC